MRRLKHVIFLTIVALFLSSCAKMTTVRSGKDYQNTLAGACNVSVLTPVVESNTLDAAGKAKRNYNYEYQIEEILADMIIERLNTKGYKAIHLTKKRMHDLSISKIMLNLQGDYMKRIKALYTPLECDEKKSVDLDIEFAKNQNLKQVLDADIVVVTEYYLKQKGSGALAKDVALAFVSSMAGMSMYQDPIEDAAESAALRVAIIDAANNKLIWSNLTREGYSAWGAVFSSAKNIDKVEKKRLIVLLDRLFAKFPKKDQH